MTKEEEARRALRFHYTQDLCGSIDEACPHGMECKVGSVNCQECEFNKGHSQVLQYIDCSYGFQNPRGCIFTPSKLYAQLEQIGEKQMTRYYTMKECFDACGEEDIPFIGNGFNDMPGKTKKELLRYDNYHPSLSSVLSDKWQIKRAEPKVVSAGEWLASSEFTNNNSNRTIYKAGDKNGQLKRDLVYRSLVKAVNEFVETGSCGALAKICEELRNIPPLED